MVVITETEKIALRLLEWTHQKSKTENEANIREKAC